MVIVTFFWVRRTLFNLFSCTNLEYMIDKQTFVVWGVLFLRQKEETEKREASTANPERNFLPQSDKMMYIKWFPILIFNLNWFSLMCFFLELFVLLCYILSIIEPSHTRLKSFQSLSVREIQKDAFKITNKSYPEKYL